LLERHGLTPDRYGIFLPGCNANGHLKRWGAARYAALAQRLHQEGLDRIVLIGGPDEMDECRRIAQACGSWLVNLCGQTAILDIPPLCEPARFIVANDTGTAHLAAATATPMLVLCGPTDPRRVKPLGDHVTTLQADLPCINCYRKTCSHHSCMAMLTPPLVLKCLRGRTGTAPD
jgi:heptosyltransferase-2